MSSAKRSKEMKSKSKATKTKRTAYITLQERPKIPRSLSIKKITQSRIKVPDILY
jgi:hypothetical protein